jgi:hypothetical protein
MDNFDYKKYSLENLENWIEDAINSSEASPQEIYDVIKNVIEDNYHCYKNHTSRCYELLALLNGNGIGHIQAYDDYVKDRQVKVCDKDDQSPECQKSWTNFWEDSPYPLYVSEDGDVWIPDSVTKEDKVVKWQLPVQVDGLTGDCFVQFPDDLLEAANLKEGDTVEWIDRKDGSFELRKVNGTK